MRGLYLLIAVLVMCQSVRADETEPLSAEVRMNMTPEQLDAYYKGLEIEKTGTCTYFESEKSPAPAIQSLPPTEKRPRRTGLAVNAARLGGATLRGVGLFVGGAAAGYQNSLRYQQFAPLTRPILTQPLGVARTNIYTDRSIAPQMQPYSIIGPNGAHGGMINTGPLGTTIYQNY